MKPLQPILTAHLFAPLHDELVALLRGLSARRMERADGRRARGR